MFLNHYNNDDRVIAGTLEARNGGTVTIDQYYRSGDNLNSGACEAHIIVSGAGSLIEQKSGNNVYNNGGNTNYVHTLTLNDGTYRTGGRDYYNGKTTISIQNGTYDANGDQTIFGSKVDANSTVQISGGTMDMAGILYFNSAAGSVGTIDVSGGSFNMSGTGKDANIGSGAGSESTIKISGGSMNISRHLSLQSGNTSLIEMEGSTGSLLIGDDLNAASSATTMSFILDASGVSPIQVTDRANINDAMLNINLTQYNPINGTDIVLIDFGSGGITGVFGSINITGGTADVNYAYDQGGGDLAFALNNISITAIPEPGSLGMLIAGLIGLRFIRRSIC